MRKGIKASEETKRRLSESHKGKHLSEEQKRKISDANKGNIPWNKGKHLSEDIRRKISETCKGKQISEEQRKKISNSLKGHRVSEEARRKISDANKGIPNHWKGKTFSEEYRKKLSEAHLGLTPWNKGKKGTQISWCKGKQKPEMRGEKHPNWNGGSSFLPYSSEFTKSLKQFIKNRDNNKCQNRLCNKKFTILTVHHIDYNKKNCLESNLITLCKRCNSLANFNRDFWKRFFILIIFKKIKERRRKK